MNTVVNLLFTVVLGALFHAFRLGLHWLLAPRGRSWRQITHDATTTSRVWHRGQFEARLTGGELLIQLTAGLLTAATLAALGYAIWRLVPASTP